MMKKFLLGATACLTMSLSTSVAQQILPCGNKEALDHLIKTIPGYKAQMDAKVAAIEADVQQKKNFGSAAKTSTVSPTYTFTVPVVFHILHLGEPVGTGSNINDNLCINALAQVNKDYARLSPDTVNIDPLYDTLYINSRIQFVLAKKDPQGNCTNGVVHHYDKNTDWKQTGYYNYIYSTVGTYNWSSSKYLNIYIVRDIISSDPNQQGIIVGYTYKPGTAPNVGADAIVYRNDFLGGIQARSLSHEIGHWLGLGHTFGDGNSAGGVCGDDDIFDTPRTSGFFSNCPQPYTALNDSCDPGRRPNINNIMDYSSCPLMFTKGQTAKMRGILQSAVANRENLSSVANLTATGIINNTVTVCAPIADFWANKTIACDGQSVTFSNTSYNSTPVTSYTWNFEGGNPSTSNAASPVVQYPATGSYSVSLMVSNANGSDVEVKSSFINVTWSAPSPSFPVAEGFEGGVIPSNWAIKNLDFGSVQWEISNYGKASNKSMILPNANGNGFYSDDVDILETPNYSFANTNNISVSFDYSYARKSGYAGGEVFKFEYSTDCGGTWLSMPGAFTPSVMANSTGSVVTAPYIPFTNKWATKTYLPATLTALNNKNNVKFRFYFNNDAMGGDAQNLYIDNFNISATVGLSELANEIGLSIYPNPTNSSSTVEFVTAKDSKALISVYDVTGRMIEESLVSSVGGQVMRHEVNKSGNLGAGVYFISLTMDGQKTTKKLIVE